MITGIPAIFVYPMTSGIASAASVAPATSSVGSRLRSKGRTPCRIASREVGRSAAASVMSRLR